MLRRIAFAGFIGVTMALSVAAVGCGASPDAGVTAETAATKAPLTVQLRGPARVLGDALGEVALRPDQRAAIEQLAHDAAARHAQDPALRAAIADEVAVEVQAGRIDRAALQPKIDAVVQAWAAERKADRAALEQLHAILDEDQRADLVDAVEDQIHERMQGHAFHAKLRAWVTDLKLTDEQQDRIRDVVKAEMQKGRADGERPWEHMRKGKKVLEAFEEDRFVLDELDPEPDAVAHAKRFGGHILDAVEAVLPILTPEQRALAALKIRALGVEDDPMAP